MPALTHHHTHVSLDPPPHVLSARLGTCIAFELTILVRHQHGFEPTDSALRRRSTLPLVSSLQRSCATHHACPADPGDGPPLRLPCCPHRCVRHHDQGLRWRPVAPGVRVDVAQGCTQHGRPPLPWPVNHTLYITITTCHNNIAPLSEKWRQNIDSGTCFSPITPTGAGGPNQNTSQSQHLQN